MKENKKSIQAGNNACTSQKSGIGAKIKNTSFLIALIVIFSVVFTACGGQGKLIYGSWQETKAPTCTFTGEETRICISDSAQTQSRPVPALGHDFGEWEEITPATQTEKGLKRAYCRHDNTHYIEEVIPASGKIDIPAPPAIPADGPGIFVLGGYATYITEAKIYAIVKDFEAYCNENAVPRAFIGWRMYSKDFNVPALSAAVRADNDVDVLLGVGNNINSAGNLDGGYVTAKSDAVTIYNDGGANDSTRRHARTNNEDLTMAFWTYILSPRAVAILTVKPA